ncbi:hypothetical protein AAG906_018283 [Vitis piasezkii]
MSTSLEKRHAETTEPGFESGSMIMSWLINSMNNDIETYSSSKILQNFSVESTLHDFRQGERITQDYNTLTRYWQHLDLFETHSWKCSMMQQHTENVEQKRLFKFFLGLNRNWMMLEVESWALNPPSLGRLFRVVEIVETDRPWCDYCKKLGHYKETCWKLHGKPADWKPKPRFDRDGNTHGCQLESTSVLEPSPFNKERDGDATKLLSQVGVAYYRCSLHR